LKFHTRFSRPKIPGIVFPELSRTKQSFKEECDIRNILKRFSQTGELPGLIQQDPRYGDFASAPSYHESVTLVAHAQQQFEALPAAVRKRFHNDPAEFLAFATDSANGREMVKMGLASETVENEGVTLHSTKKSSPKGTQGPKKAPSVPTEGEGSTK